MTVMATENRKSPYEKVREAMAPQLAAQTSEGLCVALMAIDGDRLDEPSRRTCGCGVTFTTRDPDEDCCPKHRAGGSDYYDSAGAMIHLPDPEEGFPSDAAW